MATLRYTFRGADPTSEMIADVVRLGEGGENCFAAAKLRPEDEKWWTNTVAEIVRMLRSELDAINANDAALVAEMPESNYRFARSDADKAKVREDFCKLRRRGRGWIMAIGFLMRDSERVMHEALHMGDKVIRSRSQLRAFATAIAVVVGCATVLDDNDGEE
jgi:hypothetical protein